MAHIVRRRLGTAAIGRQLARLHTAYGFRLDRIAPNRETVRQNKGKLAHRGHGLVHAEAVVYKLIDEHTGGDERLLVFRGLLLLLPGPLGAFARLAPYHERIGGKIIKGTCKFRIDQRHITIGGGKQGPVFQRLGIAVEIFLQARGIKAAGMGIDASGKRAQRLRQSRFAAGIEAWQCFRRRHHTDGLCILAAPLAGHIEKGHLIDLIAPEFHAHRFAFRGGKHIQYAAPTGKLTRTFHLVAGLIARAQQTILHVLNGDGIAPAERKRRI